REGIYLPFPDRRPWESLRESEKADTLASMARYFGTPGAHALSVIEHEVDAGKLPAWWRRELEVLREEIDAGRLEGHVPPVLGEGGGLGMGDGEIRWGRQEARWLIGQIPEAELGEGALRTASGKWQYQVWHDMSWPHSRTARLTGGPRPRFPDDYAH